MSFANSCSVTIDHTKCGASDSSNFPVLINSIDARFKTVGNGGLVQNASGYDIRPFSDSGLTTPLSYELERYGPTTGEVVMNVKLPTVSHSVNTVFYLGFGDSTISTDGSSATNTFSNSFACVFHFKDGTTLSILDALNLVAISGSPLPTAGVGQIDGGAAFASASSQYLETTTTGPGTAAFTLTGWAKATTFPNDYNPCLMNRGFSSNDYYGMFIRSADSKLYCVVQATAVVSYDGTGTKTVSTGAWTHLAMTYDSVNGLKSYVNGALDTTVAANGGANTTLIAMGIGRQRSTGTRYWNGILDEQRFASVARSADWILTEYNNQNSPSTFYTLGGTISGGGGASSLGFFRLAG